MRSFVLVAIFGLVAIASAKPGFFNRGDVENKWEFGFETKTIPGRPIQLKIERGALPKEGEDKGTLNAIYTKHVENRNKLLSKLLGKPVGQNPEQPAAEQPEAEEPVAEEPQAEQPAEEQQSALEEAKATFAILKQRHDERVKKLLGKLFGGHKQQAAEPEQEEDEEEQNDEEPANEEDAEEDDQHQDEDQSPAQDSAQDPAEESAQEPAEEPAQEPAEEPAQEPAQEPAEEPAQEPAEEPAKDEAEAEKPVNEDAELSDPHPAKAEE